MQLRKILALGSSPIALAYMLVMPTAAFAQSTGTLEMEEIVVTGRQVKESLGGTIVAEQVSKSRSTITEEFLQTQVAGQSVVQSINLLPGVSFTNNDPYGASGGNLRLRSFDGPRISITFDGLPLNDTGNYALYTNQLIDPEIIDQTTVNLGTTDVDSPTASATGGTINILSRKPSDVLKLTGVASVGSFNERRVFASIDTGMLTDAGTTAFLAASYQKYDAFKGPGTLERWQFNGKVYQPIGDRDFVSLAFHWNRNRNNAYRALSTLDITPQPPATNPLGTKLDYISNCVHSTPQAGRVDNDNSTSTLANDPNANTATCTNFIDHRINPSNTGNIRMQSSFHLMDNLQLTVDPNFQYTLATGGTTVSAVSEMDGRLQGTKNTGVDINGDGDTLDNIRVYAPSVTNTYRYGVTASLIYRFMENQAVRASYTLDYGRHRQTGDGAKLDSNYEIVDYFPHYNRVNELLSNDGLPYRFRDRFSIAELNQVSGSYSGGFFDDQIKVDAGLRLPYFHRELNQYCYTQSGTSNAYCTTQIPSAPNALGYVTFPNSPAPGNATQYLRPFSATRDYDKVLPNFGLSYRPDGGPSMFYASFSQGLSAPRTDDLYTANLPPGGSQVAQIPNVLPETTDSYEVGYRYQTSKLITSLALWKIDYQNRIVTSFDPITLLSVARNIGSVELYGADGEIGFSPVEGLTLYASASYDHSKLLNNFQVTATTFAPTAGKKLVETPDWTFSLRGQYVIDDFQFGAQLKYTGDRFATDVNDEVAPSYTLVDLDARYNLTQLGLKNTYLQLNVTNLFDKTYLGSISSRTTSTVGAPGYSGLPTYNIGAPRTFQGSVHVEW